VKNEHIIAYILIGIGALALLWRIGGGADWFWTGLVAAGFIGGYLSQKKYGFLIPGCILAGVAVGSLFDSWPASLISLGIGFIMIDRIEPRQKRWPIYVGGALAAIGLLSGLSSGGFLNSLWFALILIALGIVLMGRKTRRNTWVTVPDSAAPTAGSDSEATAQAIPHVATSPQVVDIEAVRDTEPAKAPDSEDSSPPLFTTETAEEVTSADASLSDPELYARLEQWRRETARSEDRAAYLILTNASLQEIASKKPQSLEELLSIKGIGPVKLERYGEALIKLVQGV
jgi:hypothetical protein